MQLTKRKITLLLLLTFLVSTSAWFCSIYLMNLSLEYFDSPKGVPFLTNAISYFGYLALSYLGLLSRLLPENIQLSAVGTIAGLLSAFVMTIPLTFGLFMLFGRFKKSKTEDEKLG